MIDRQLITSTGRLEALTRELGIDQQLRLLGYRDDIARFSASDICVCCSDYEGVPLSVMEYMAAGKPVLSTKDLRDRLAGRRRATNELSFGRTLSEAEDLYLRLPRQKAWRRTGTPRTRNRANSPTPPGYGVPTVPRLTPCVIGQEDDQGRDTS